MALDPGAKRFLDRLAALHPPSARGLSVGERREALASLLGFAGLRPPIAAVEDRTIAGPAGELPLRLYTPVGCGTRTALPGLIYFHGGGLVAGSLDTHDGICRQLANASACRIASVGYRLAPEHPFPAAIEDGKAAVRSIAARAGEFRIEAGAVAVGGDSAGATLAAVVCQQLVTDLVTDERPADAKSAAVRIGLQFLLCPILDFRADNESRRALASGYFLDQATLEHDLAHYLREGGDPADARVSPLRAKAAVLGRLPPACIHAAEFDPLRDEAKAYARRLGEAGVNAVFRCHGGMIHLFYGLGALIPRAAEAFELMGRDIRTMLTRGNP